MAKVKKVDPKKVAKNEVSAAIVAALVAAGYAVDTNHEDYGFTEGTVVVSLANVDVQIKLIAPKAGVDRYAKVDDEVVAEVVATVTEAADETVAATEAEFTATELDTLLD
jgi:hypothetical protein